jgi:hypothetical protein
MGWGFVFFVMLATATAIVAWFVAFYRLLTSDAPIILDESLPLPVPVRTLEACNAGSPEETGFKAIADAFEAYEAKRWPDGKVPGGKG